MYPGFFFDSQSASQIQLIFPQNFPNLQLFDSPSYYLNFDSVEAQCSQRIDTSQNNLIFTEKKEQEIKENKETNQSTKSVSRNKISKKRKNKIQSQSKSPMTKKPNRIRCCSCCKAITKKHQCIHTNCKGCLCPKFLRESCSYERKKQRREERRRQKEHQQEQEEQ